MSTSPKTLYILYNADGSILGKLKYGYRKLKSSPDCEPTCAACDITHGGLSLSETPAWTAAKKEIEASGDLKVVQWHRDEVSPALKEFLTANQIKYPTVIIEQNEGDFRQIVSNTDLAAFKGDARAFVEQLKEQGLMKQRTSASL
ncbi:hypothetical protein AOQ84DRAFT_436369 [Glonium stellatum]|uniref:Uncharacterized protein n=1 Tax=Glonium stellatum TaxID=574774 RepID=A0A8E2FA41_9PEZI|nr:hypothetical protein AOQ84DRAFT_436369 [Glonium stellatum]